MTPPYADLHTHTTCSDGLLSPQELIAKAIVKQIAVLAITDHDTMEAHRILAREGGVDGLRLIPGIELSCQEHGREVHVLGYYLDADNDELKSHELHSRGDRDRRGREMVEKLRRAGLSITYDEVVAEAAGAPITRPHVAAVLVRNRCVANMPEAFDKWLERGRIGFAERSPFSVRDAVELIRHAGGVSIVAHPGRTYQDPRLFLALISMGVDGLEVYHPSHWQVTREYYRLLAQQHGLLISGGSDYHGSRSYDEENFGSVGCTAEHVDAIHTRSVQRRLHG